MNETPDQARTRRRWISLAEIATIAGLLIGAGGLYLNWEDRREDQAEKASAANAQDRANGVVTLTATIEHGNLMLADAAHTLSGATIRFPSVLGVSEKDAMPGPRIDKDWFASTLLKATDGGPDERTGRLPVLITTTWWDGDRQRQNRSVYDILWRTKGHMLRGRSLDVTGLTLRSRNGSSRSIDAAWTSQKI